MTLADVTFNQCFFGLMIFLVLARMAVQLFRVNHPFKD